MGSVCNKGPTQAEPELDMAEAGNKEHDGNKSGLSVDFEKQFLKMLEEITVPEGPLKEKLAQLPPFEFDTSRDCSSLTIVTSNEQTEGEKYFGFWDPIQNMREYKGVIVYSDGGCFMGHFNRGQIYGKGRKITSNLTIYEGDFVANREEGKGKCTQPDGSTYEGDWKDGKQDGYGIEVLVNNQKYEGHFSKGVKHGKGTCKLADGAVYEGDFVEGNFEGKGKYTYTNGKVYEGDWKDGRENGNGVLKYKSGNVYTGEFANGVPHGKGKIEYSNGDPTREGTWVEGKQEGRFMLSKPGLAPQYVEIKANQIVGVIVPPQAEGVKA